MKNIIKNILLLTLLLNQIFAPEYSHAATKAIIKADITEGQESVPNFLKGKGHYEKTVNGTTAYADSGSRPTDGTGGAPTLTCTRTTSSPLDGDGSLLITKDAANRQGQGCAIQFTIDSAYKAKVLQIEMDYIVGSGTFTAGTSSTDSDLIVYIYDVTNSTLIEPSSIKFLASSTTLPDKFVANFQTSATGTTYNLILHQATTSSSAYTFKADNLQVKPSQYVYGTPITDWQSYTPTGSWSTNTTYTGRWRRVGDNAEYNIGISLAGAPTATSLTANLVSGHVIDTTKFPLTPSNNDTIIGKSSANDSGTSYALDTYYSSTTAVTVKAVATSATWGSGGTVSNTVPVTFGASDTLNINFTVPITGWSSSVQMSDSYDGRQIAFSAYLNSTTTFNNTTIIYDVKSFDKTASYSTSTGIFTAPKSGLVLAVAQGFSTTTAVGIALKKNGNSVARSYQTSTANDDYAHIIKVVEVNAGDTLRIDTDGNYSIYGGAVDNYFEVYYLNSPQTMSATDLMSFVAEGASSSAIGSSTTIPFNTPTRDTHACWNSTNKDCAVPNSGEYKVYCQLRVTSGGATVNQYLDTIIQIDTVSKREFLKYVENTGVGGWSAGTSWQGWLNAGQKIRCVGDTSIGTPSLTTGSTHTFMEIYRIK